MSNPVIVSRAEAVKGYAEENNVSVNVAAEALVAAGWTDIGGKSPGNASLRNAYREVFGSSRGPRAASAPAPTKNDKGKNGPVAVKYDPSIVDTGDVALASELEELTAALVQAADVLAKLRDEAPAILADVRIARALRATLTGGAQ